MTTLVCALIWACILIFEIVLTRRRYRAVVERERQAQILDQILLDRLSAALDRRSVALDKLSQLGESHE